MAAWNDLSPWGFLLLFAAAVAQTVNYQDPVCAVEGSTVTLLCTFTPIRSFMDKGREVLLQIIRVRWCVNHLVCQGTTPTVYDSDSQNNDPRYQYLGDKTGNCTLQIRDVQRKDSTTFRFRMEATDIKGHFIGQSGASITVADNPDLRINSSSGQRAVTEGHSVTLHCTSVCTFHQLNVTWFRDDHALSETGPALRLDSLAAKDSGNYTCVLSTDAGLRSPPYSLRVEKGPDGAHWLLVVRLVLFALCTVLTVTMAAVIIKRTCVGRKAAAESCV